LADGRYRQEVIGSAADVLTADGLHTHSFHQASAFARDRVQCQRADAAGSTDGRALTVGDIVSGYLIDREKRELDV
jgi:hypothetical protein